VHLLVTNTTELLLRAQFIQEQERAIGITVVIDSFDSATSGAKLARGDFDTYLSAFGPGLPDPSFVLNAGFTSTGVRNFSGYANPELDGWIEQSGLVGAPRDRRDTLQRCLRVLTRDLPFIPLFVPHEIYGVSDDLAFEPRLDGNLLAQEMRRR